MQRNTALSGNRRGLKGSSAEGEDNVNLIQKISRQRLFSRLSISGINFNSEKKSPAVTELECEAKLSASPSGGSPSLECSPKKRRFIFNDKTFKLDECIGSGHSAKVYACSNEANDSEKLAIKLFKKKAKANHAAAELARVTTEAHILQRLSHQRIVTYCGVVETPTEIGLLMEHCPGGTLKRLYQKQGALDEAKCAFYLLQVLEGLEYLHSQGIVHRDIKAANILLKSLDRIKLSDFGIAQSVTRVFGEAKSGAPKALELETKEKPEAFSGEFEQQLAAAAYWIAPELVLLHDATPAADVWSVGCLAIELFTTNPPYATLGPISALFFMVHDEHPPLPHGLSQLFERFLLESFQKDPVLRPGASLLKSHPWVLKNMDSPGRPKIPELATPRSPPVHFEAHLIASNSLRSPSEKSVEAFTFQSELLPAPTSKVANPKGTDRRQVSPLRPPRLVNSTSTLIDRAKSMQDILEAPLELERSMTAAPEDPQEGCDRSLSRSSASSTSTTPSVSSSKSSFLVTKPQKAYSAELVSQSDEEQHGLAEDAKRGITKLILDTVLPSSQPPLQSSLPLSSSVVSDCQSAAGCQSNLAASVTDVNMYLEPLRQLSSDVEYSGEKLGILLDKSLQDPTFVGTSKSVSGLTNLARLIMRASSNEALKAPLRLAELWIRGDTVFQEHWCRLGMVSKMLALCSSSASSITTTLSCLTILFHLCSSTSKLVVFAAVSSGVISELILLMPAYLSTTQNEKPSALYAVVHCLHALITTPNDVLASRLNFIIAQEYCATASIYRPGRLLVEILVEPMYQRVEDESNSDEKVHDIQVIQTKLLEIIHHLSQTDCSGNVANYIPDSAHVLKSMLHLLGNSLEASCKSHLFLVQIPLVLAVLHNLCKHGSTSKVLEDNRFALATKLCRFLCHCSYAFATRDGKEALNDLAFAGLCSNVRQALTIVQNFASARQDVLARIANHPGLALGLLSLLSLTAGSKSDCQVSIEELALGLVCKVLLTNVSVIAAFFSQSTILPSAPTKDVLIGAFVECLVRCIDRGAPLRQKALSALNIWLHKMPDKVEPILLRTPFVNVIIKLYQNNFQESEQLLALNEPLADIVKLSPSIKNQLSQLPFVEALLGHMQASIQSNTSAENLLGVVTLLSCLSKSSSFVKVKRNLPAAVQKLVDEVLASR